MMSDTRSHGAMTAAAPVGRVTMVPELDLARVRRYCRERIPVHLRDRIRLDVDVTGRRIAIVERRAPWTPEIGPEWTALRLSSGSRPTALGRSSGRTATTSGTATRSTRRRRSVDCSPASPPTRQIGTGDDGKRSLSEAEIERRGDVVRGLLEESAPATRATSADRATHVR